MNPTPPPEPLQEDRGADGAWQAHARQLATWVLERLANRTDRAGGYYIDKLTGVVKPVTRPERAESNYVTQSLLEAHFHAMGPHQIVGLHALSADSQGKWAALDIDAHQETDETAINECFALAKYRELAELGFHPLLTESNGKGGFHLRVLFSEPISGKLLFRFGKWLLRGHEVYGITQNPEAFPKQGAIKMDGWGNWLRTFGKHHKRDFWPRVWGGAMWLEGEAAIAFILKLSGDSPSLIPSEVLPPPEEDRAPQGPSRAPAGPNHLDERPGDHFNRTASWHDILTPHGWKVEGERPDKTEWTRPGKDGGVSATTRFCKSDDGKELFYCFSDAAGVIPARPLDKFALYAHLNHSGNYSAAGSALRRLGYCSAKSAAAFDARTRASRWGMRDNIHAEMPAEPPPDEPDGGVDEEAAGDREPPINFRDPCYVARLFLGHVSAKGWFTALPRGAAPFLRYYRQDFYRFDGSQYRKVSTAEMQAELWTFLEDLYVSLWRRAMEAYNRSAAESDGTGDGVEEEQKERPPQKTIVTSKFVGEARAALQSQVILPDELNAPCWIGGVSGADPKRMIAFPNGLLDTVSKEFVPPTPDYFVLATLGVPYQPAAPAPKRWLEFLAGATADAESAQAVQELFGLMLVPDTSYQAIPAVVGPKGSGKSTVTGRLQSLLGTACVGTSLSQLGESFGLSPLVGASVALIADASFARCSPLSVEMLKAISGESVVGINRKGKEYLSAFLGVRFVLATNDVPQLPDSSGALMRRMALISFPYTVADSDIDPKLAEKLDAELPVILIWALAGLDTLRGRGRFIRPQSAAGMVQEMANVCSPIGQFVRECLELAPDYSCPADKVYQHWCRWAVAQGDEKVGTKAAFSVALRPLVPGFDSKQKRIPGTKEKPWHYFGARLKADEVDSDVYRHVPRDTAAGQNHEFASDRAEGW